MLMRSVREESRLHDEIESDEEEEEDYAEINSRTVDENESEECEEMKRKDMWGRNLDCQLERVRL
jgi:hypothetical protein